MPMKYNEDMVIPGFSSLSYEMKVTFHSSFSGQKLFQTLQKLSSMAQKKERSTWWWESFTGTVADKERQFQEQVDLEIKELFAEISVTEEYKTIIIHLTHLMLEKEIEDFQFLTKEQKEFLARADFSIELHYRLNLTDSLIVKEKNRLDKLGLLSQLSGSERIEIEEHITQLQIERKKAINEWGTTFLSDPQLISYRETIEKRKEIIRQEQLAAKRASLHEHARQLSTFFPILNYRKFSTEEPIINQLFAKYFSADGEIVQEPDKVDEELLSDILYFCMQQMNKIEIDFMNLDAFNKKHAHRMTLAMLKAFKEKTDLNLDKWFQEYEEKLHHHILKRLQLINGKPWSLSENTVGQELLHSLSFLWDNRAINRVNEFLGKMADAHGFIQATSFSTQNESSFLAILDMYNYARHHEQISETRTVISNLLSPLHPLYNEYRDIALYERNAYLKFFRTIMPILIIVAFIILVAVILGPLALPELAFTAAFIPALLIGLCIANIYVSVKNDIYKYLREQYYGGPFEIPEFQINPRMINAFGSSENATKVRHFYVDNLRSCDELEEAFRAKHEHGLLSQEDIDLRKANTKKRYHLSLEWYDIHSNKDLNYEKTPLIVMSRLHQTCDEEYQLLQKTLKEENRLIRQSVSEVTSDLKDTIIKNNTVPAVEPEKKTEIPTIKTNYRNGLFTQPRALKAKAHMEELADFCEQLNLAAS